MNQTSAVKAIVIAGVGMALLGNLPLVNFVNCVLCIWVWLGGGLAVYLYNRFQGGQAPATTGQAAGLGALAGVVGALVGAVVYYLTASLSAPLMAQLLQALNVQSDLSIGTQNPGSALGGSLFWLVLDIVLYPGFGALGGLVTANLLKRRSANPPAAAT